MGWMQPSVMRKVESVKDEGRGFEDHQENSLFIWGRGGWKNLDKLGWKSDVTKKGRPGGSMIALRGVLRMPGTQQKCFNLKDYVVPRRV